MRLKSLSSLHENPKARRTFRELGRKQLGALCAATGLDSCRETANALFDTFLTGWGDRPVEQRPGWPSGITDDHSPFEFSLAVEGLHRELRFLVEAQERAVTSLAGTWEAGQRLNEELRRSYGISLERFDEIKDLFAPEDPGAWFALWHAVCLRAGEPPAFKIYMNPQVRGPAQAEDLVREALRRLGLHEAGEFLTERVLRRPEDRLAFLSLDLASHEDARVKAYVAHPRISAMEVESLLACAGSDLVPGEASAFCRAMAGDDGPYADREVDTCYAFTAASGGRPSNTTLYIPIRAYVDDDQVAFDRIHRYLEPEQRDAWRQLVDAMATRPLASGRGLVQWVSVKRSQGQRRLTYYFTPELYSASRPRPTAQPDDSRLDSPAESTREASAATE